MIAESDWTAEWAAKKLRDNSHVRGITVVAPGRIEVSRHGLPTIIIATLSVAILDDVLLEAVLAKEPHADFVLNLKSGASLTKEALLMSFTSQVPVGHMGNVSEALSLPQVRLYTDPETAFRERGLRQHSRVTTFERLDLHRYCIERDRLPPLTAVFLNDYDLVAEGIRHARDELGPFDIVVASNPNGRITDGAEEVARQLGCEIHKWGSFLSRLHREHNKS